MLEALDGWAVEWSGTRTSGKLVRLRHRATGRVAQGHDWRDWDLALQRALGEALAQIDLVGEIEDYLRRL